MSNRTPIPEETITRILCLSARICCLCFGIKQDFQEKRGQIAHLDQNPNNNAEHNLAFLCLDHHAQYDSTSRQHKGLTIGEVKQYRDQLYQIVDARRQALANNLISDLQKKKVGIEEIQVTERVVTFPRRFSIVDVFEHLNPYQPLPEEYKVKNGLYCRIVPGQFGVTDRGFFLQVCLLEFDFEKFSPAHSAKTSFLLVAKRNEAKRLITDDREVELPVMVCYICVNRALFPPQPELEDVVAWGCILSQRTFAIAHEACLVDHYANFFDFQNQQLVVTDNLYKNSSLVSELICPFSRIEQMLVKSEARCRITISSEKDFTSTWPKNFHAHYLGSWLKAYSADSAMVWSRTVEYLSAGRTSKFHEH